MKKRMGKGGKCERNAERKEEGKMGVNGAKLAVEVNIDRSGKRENNIFKGKQRGLKFSNQNIGP